MTEVAVPGPGGEDQDIVGNPALAIREDHRAALGIDPRTSRIASEPQTGFTDSLLRSAREALEVEDLSASAFAGSLCRDCGRPLVVKSTDLSQTLTFGGRAIVASKYLCSGPERHCWHDVAYPSGDGSGKAAFVDLLRSPMETNPED